MPGVSHDNAALALEPENEDAQLETGTRYLREKSEAVSFRRAIHTLEIVRLRRCIVDQESSAKRVGTPARDEQVRRLYG